MIGRPDIVFPGHRAAVFVDGDFWHGREWPKLRRELSMGSNADYWVAKIARNRARDREVTASLESDGWAVVRVWESEIKADAEKAASRVKERILNHVRCHPP